MHMLGMAVLSSVNDLVLNMFITKVGFENLATFFDNG